jgi:dolichol kinase
MFDTITINPVDRKFSARNDLHLVRKIWHITTGLLAIFAIKYFDVSKEVVVYTSFSIGFIALTTDLLRVKISSLNQLVCFIFGPIMRKKEVQKVTGMPFYAFGVGLATLFFQPEIAFLAILFLVLADPISSLFGVLYGKTKILPNKSLQGSLAGFFVCYTICFLYLQSSGLNNSKIFVFSVIAGIIGSISELVSGFKIDDNITIPVLSGIGLTLMNQLLPVF